MNNQWARFVLCSVFILFCSNALLAQLENTRWYFGRPAVGMYFDPNNNFTPSVLNNSLYPDFAFETAGVVTDPVTGELLFYTNGDVVLNKNHQQMPNGYGLGACFSSAQAVGLAPVPGTCNKFYVFSNSIQNCTGYFQRDIHWSIVDMTLDNGLGDVEVATKNTVLHTDNKESLLVIQRPGFDEYWVISVVNPNFQVYHIDASGISLAGQYPSNIVGNEYIFNMGYSQQTGKLASTFSLGIRISDFDANTGIISNTYLLNSPPGAIYDAEFSPDGTKLYYSIANGTTYQYDFLTSIETLIYQSPFVQGGGGGLCTGPEGKIYLIPDYYVNEYVCVISNPNGAGVNCNFINNYLNMGMYINGFNFPATLPGNIDKLTASFSVSTDPCADQTEGNAVIMAASGTAPYSYEWSNGAIGDTLRRVGVGTYYVTTTDAIGCKRLDTVFVNQANVQFYLNPLIYGIPCDGNGTAGVDLQPSGGTPPYTVVWADGNSNVTRFGLSAGQYSVTASDAGGCTFPTTINIIQPTPIVVTETHTDVGCGGQNTGTITLSVSGGQPGYSYSWSDNVYTKDRSGLAPGNYTVKVFDAAQCFTELLITIGQNNGLNVSISATDVSCFGGNDGTATAVGNGGTGPYSYLWSNNEITSTISGLSTGTYGVTVTDGFGCSGSDTITVGQNPQLTLTETHTDASCGNANGSINLTASGGQAGYTFTWNDNNTDQNRTTLAAGSYNVTVEDAVQCTATLSITIGQSAGPSLMISATDVSCFGGNNGTATVVATGGTVPYSYLWSNNEITSTISGLSTGTYGVTVTDGFGCSGSDTITVGQNPQLTLTETHTDASCGNANGSINLTASGGQAGYTFTWNDNNTDQNRTTLAAGSYNVTVEDAVQCTATLSITIGQSAGPSLMISATDVSCFGDGDGSATVVANGGAAPYSYLWSNNEITSSLSGLSAGTYSVTVTDATGCNASDTITVGQNPQLSLTETHTDASCGNVNGSITLTASGGQPGYTFTWNDNNTDQNRTTLAAGSYTVTVEDAIQCTATLSVTIAQSTGPNINITSTDVSCFGGNDGTATVVTNGGAAPYSYIWSNNDVTSSLSNLSAGVYSVTVTDATGCNGSDTITVGQNAQLTLAETHTDASCGNANGSITLTVNGGQAGYTFSWNNNSSNQNRTGLTAGSYSVTAEDAAQCTATLSITIGQSSGPSLSISATDVSCYGGNDGTATVVATGGTVPYSYLWSNNEITSSISGLVAGAYEVTVTDATGCNGSDTVNIEQPPLLEVTLQSTDISCFGDSSAIITSVVSGGVPNYVYLWNNSTTSAGLSNQPAGSYSLTVTDNNQCSAITDITVSQPGALSVDILPIDTLTIGESVILQTNAQTNPGNTTYLWQPATGLSCTDCPEPTASVIQDTQYFVTIDNNGCSATDSIWVFIIPDSAETTIPSLFIPNAFSPNNDGLNDVFYIYGNGISKISWSVFDRWGELVFSSNELNRGWDGKLNSKLLPPGVFVVNVYVEFIDLGSRQKTQSVMLMR